MMVHMGFKIDQSDRIGPAQLAGWRPGSYDRRIRLPEEGGTPTLDVETPVRVELYYDWEPYRPDPTRKYQVLALLALKRINPTERATENERVTNLFYGARWTEPFAPYLPDLYACNIYEWILDTPEEAFGYDAVNRYLRARLFRIGDRLYRTTQRDPTDQRYYLAPAWDPNVQRIVVGLYRRLPKRTGFARTIYRSRNL